MKKAVLLSILLVVGLAVALPAKTQEKPESGKAQTEALVSKVIPVKYADVRRINGLIAIFGATIRADPELRVITASGTASNVAAVEEAIKKLDVPSPPTRDIDLTMYILAASQQPGQSEKIPADLGDVVEQMKRVLNYKEFRLLNTVLIRARDGARAGASGAIMDGVGENQKADFDFNFDEANVSSEGKTLSVKIRGMHFEVSRPASLVVGDKGAKREGTSATINTSIDLPEGQKVVVGKTTFESPNSALILVLTAKVVD
jgi:type II/III secretion system protein